jgi:hypothetical protein
MLRRSIAPLLAVAMVAAAIPTPAASAADLTRSAGFTVPINVVSPTQGSFTGNLKIVGFAADSGQLMAAGILSGTRTDANGLSTGIVRMVSLPVITGNTSGGASAGTSAPLACEVLHLELGPLDLNLLGLVVHLDKVVLDITAVPGAGNLLGNLLCSITGLLNGGANLRQLASLLNDLLGILG